MKLVGVLDDLALFALVADCGGLSEAARQSGTSLPTLGRRMTQLERSLGRRLFLRGKARYALTADGRALRATLEQLSDLENKVTQWVKEGRQKPYVRITAGLWTSRFLTQCVARDWHGGMQWVPEFLASNMSIDIARREADIGVRNRQPNQPWLAGRRTGVVEYAVYACEPKMNGFISLSSDAATTPSERWLRATHEGDITIRASDARLMLDLALGGMGKIILPCFAGEAEAGLQRISDPIDDLTHDEWLVCHHEARNDPPIRRAMDYMARILSDKGRVSPQR